MMGFVIKSNSNIKVVVIGGGTGSFSVLKGLKKYTSNITALVNMCDNGGSTGKLRDELGVLPPGDVRQCLMALSNTPDLGELFDLRFSSGSLKDHSFGNIFLAALEKYTGDFAQASELAGNLLNITGKVEPISLQKIDLAAHFNDGSVLYGESSISYGAFAHQKPHLQLVGDRIQLYKKATSAINTADLIIIAPGSLYGSIGPTLITPGLKKAFQDSHAKKVYICNLVTKHQQTDNFFVEDFAEEVERFIGYKALDYVIYNTSIPSEQLMKKYSRVGDDLVKLNPKITRHHYQLLGHELLHIITNQTKQIAGIERSVLRHDSDRLAQVLINL